MNVVICGTPGTGKSTIVEKLKPLLNDFNFVNISEFAIKKNCITVFDETLSSHVLNEEKLFQELEPILNQGKNNVFETIHPLFENDEVDCVFVCRTNNTILHDRLTARGYSSKKLENNMQAEIFQTIYDEVSEDFDEYKIISIQNDNLDDLDRNVKLIQKTIEELQNHG